ncbi:MAG: T9SS type A sorting domain-containing protein [Candidatus Eiseniibacteriota bacterium]
MRVPNIFTACVLAFICALSAAPSRASSFGQPSMYVIAAKIAPPYTATYNLNTGVAAWPLLLEPHNFDQTSADALGHLNVLEYWDALDTLENASAARAQSDGVYGSVAHMKDLVQSPGYVGDFGYAQLSQNFVVDSIGAYCNFHIGVTYYPFVAARAVAVDDVRAEFAIDVDATWKSQPIYHFHQDAGARAWAGPAGPTFHTHVAHGPMTYTDALFPPTLNFTETLVFDPYTGSVDLSSLNVGDTFSVVFKSMAQAAWIPGEVPLAESRIYDPAGGGGITIDVAGVHSLDNATNPILAAGGPKPLKLATLTPAHPNPSPGAVALSLELTRDGEYSVDVFDLSGRHVGQLAHGSMSAGSHPIEWNPSAGRAGAPSAGVYFVRARGPGLNAVQRVVRVNP